MSRFSNDEEGALTIFACFMVFLMLMVCGIAVDLMQNEMMRTRVQNTLDRAILAASDLEQPLPPDDVVDDYFAKAGMSEFLENVQITPGADLPTTNYRIVQATARTQTPSIYMAMSGVNSLPVFAAGTAEEVIENTEISLVIDISGSMRNNKKMDNLRIAAKEFIATVLEGNAAKTTSLNIVPYAGQVNPGPIIFNRASGNPFATYITNDEGEEELYGYTYIDDEGNEIVVPYNTIAHCLELENGDFDNMNLPSGGYDQVPYFMNWKIAADVMDWGWCPQDNSAIRYAQNSISELQTFIDEIRMHDGTGTHYGMKYGVALLNPSSNDAFRELHTAGLVQDGFEDRPKPFDGKDVRKYIVLMTDGQITDQYRPDDPNDSENPTVVLNNRKDEKIKRTKRSENLESFYSACDLAEENDIIVYTIAFEAPASAQTEMKNCANPSTNYYKVEGVAIATVFKAIARQINELRLVQ
ncbi:MAG: pilus assembly protein TadG-related protein [Pseudomonadota bacterium]